MFVERRWEVRGRVRALLMLVVIIGAGADRCSAAAGLQLRLGTNKVSSIAFSADGTLLASGNTDATVRLWDARTGTLVRTLIGKYAVTSTAISLTDKQVASSDNDNRAMASLVTLWDTRTGQSLWERPSLSGTINVIAFSPDGQTVARGAVDGTVALYDVRTGDEQRKVEVPHDPEVSVHVNSIAFSSDGRTLASGSSDGAVLLWALPEGRLTRRLQRHPDDAVTAVALAPDGRTIASGRRRWVGFRKVYEVVLWDVETGRLTQTLKGHRDEVRSVAFSPDGRRVASASGDWTVKLWDVQTGKLKRTLGMYRSGVNSVAFSPDGKTMASGSSDGTVRLISVRSGRLLVTWVIRPPSREGEVSSEWVAFTPEGYYAGGTGKAPLPPKAGGRRRYRPDRVQRALQGQR
jgi:WD40 repeat protein